MTLATIALTAGICFSQDARKWLPPYETLSTPTGISGLEDRIQKGNSAVWLEGDVLHFLAKSNAKRIDITGGIQTQLSNIPGTEYWILRLRMKGWEKAFVGYAFLPLGASLQNIRFEEWRGADAPRRLDVAQTLAGRIVNREIISQSLGEKRGVSVYLPPIGPKADIPAVFLADGICETIARYMEPLMVQGKVEPFAIVGVPSGGYIGPRQGDYDPSKDLRAKEYVPGNDPERFDKHMQFFTVEVLDFVAKEFGISRRRGRLAIGGVSNGGAFSAAAAFRKPDVFGSAIPLSLGVPPTDQVPKKGLPNMYFAAGTLESFVVPTTKVFEIVKASGANAELKTYVAGHDMLMWELAFGEYLAKIFKSRD